MDSLTSRYDKQVKAIVVFGDIRGFSVWEQSVTRPEIEFKPLMNCFDAMVDEFEAKTGYFTKNLGDGYMQIVELQADTHDCIPALRVLKETVKFATSVQTVIRKSPWPRPDGFRVRVSSGHVWKKQGNKTDYVGRHVNLAHKLLRVSPQTEFLAHQSFLELMARRQTHEIGVKFAKLPPDRRIPDGVLKADMNALWSFRKA